MADVIDMSSGAGTDDGSRARAAELAEMMGIMDGIIVSAVEGGAVTLDVRHCHMSAREFRDRAERDGLLIAVRGDGAVILNIRPGTPPADVMTAASIIEGIAPKCPGGVCKI